MKYESNILKRLIDTYGVVGNPRYISEIIKEFIVQGKERFPNLFTYQSDWLAHIDEFGLNPSYSVSYTGQSIYAPNTLERPVKSAILKGQTLVNLIVDKSDYENKSGDININIIGNTVTANTNYTLLFDIDGDTSSTFTYGFLKGSQWLNGFLTTNVGKSKILINTGNTTTDDTIKLRLRTSQSVVRRLVLLEGDYTNVDIPYFEGMQSVKMPVLTSVGKNLFNGEWELGSIHPETGGDVENKNCIRTKDFFVVESNKEYTISNNKGYTVTSNFYDYAKNLISTSSAKTFITPSNSYFVKFRTSPSNFENDISIKFQLEQGSVATAYEPHKTNILTVNEEVELRGIGEGSNRVEDELDCLTGKVVERIGEIVLDGGEDEVWTRNISLSNDNYSTSLFTLNVKGIKRELNNGLSKKCDKFPVNPDYSHSNDIEGIHQIIDNQIAIRVLKTKLSEDSAEGFNSWLSNNPLTVQYKLLTESVKTVDLNILNQNRQNIEQLMSFNGGTHIITGSAEGSPLPVVSVSVETDLKETLRVCSLEGNTL